MIDLVPIDRDIGRRSGYGPPEAGRNVDHFAQKIGEFDEEAIVAYLEENGVTSRPQRTALRRSRIRTIGLFSGSRWKFCGAQRSVRRSALT